MKLPISSYSTLVFDCDGVVLDSNKVKTEAFYQVALPYGETAANALVEYHVANGGVSRYKKFQYFLDEVVLLSGLGSTLDELLASYAKLVRAGLMECAVADGIHELREAYPEQRWLIVSGGDQIELREVFYARGLDALFDGGVFGSPETKDEILSREISLGNISSSALFIGDSIYDFRAANAKNLDFVFVSGWTEVENWPRFVNNNALKQIGHLIELID